MKKERQMQKDMIEQMEGHPTYVCENCREEWGFFPEDYENPKDWPTRCPLCSMSVFQLIKDTYQGGGLSEVWYWLKARYF